LLFGNKGFQQTFRETKVSIKPTLSVPIFGGTVIVHAFGREHGHNFSFKGIDDSDKPHTTHSQIFEALASVSAGVEAFAAPSPTRMNAEIVWPGDIPLAIPSGPYTPPGERFRIYRGLYADGVRNLDSTQGYAMSAADCALIVAKSGELIVAAHAGRDSIIDMNYYKIGKKREHESVVETICTSVFDEGQIAELEVWVGFSISPGPHFQHVKGNSRYPHNAAMVNDITARYGKECFRDDGQNGELGWLDTKELIRRQFMHFGTPEENILLDSMCTHNDQKDGEHLWYSNVRSGEYRNLIAVVVNP
jgi:copper oxidase (laccase) domain-containing protein